MTKKGSGRASVGLAVGLMVFLAAVPAYPGRRTDGEGTGRGWPAQPVRLPADPTGMAVPAGAAGPTCELPFSLALGTRTENRCPSIPWGRVPFGTRAPSARPFGLPGNPAPAVRDELRARTLAGDFLRDAGRIWSYPAHIKSRDVLPLFALAAAVAIVIPNDEAIYRGFRDFRDDQTWVASLSPVITAMGSYGAWGTVGAFLGVGLLAGNARAVETAALAASAMIQTTLVIQVGKGLSGRQRPSWENGIDHWAGPAAFFKRYESGQTDHYDSFPSGHAGTAFSLATVIAMEYRETVWVPIAAYTVAAGVGLSRLTEDKHWMSDVLVGAVVGHVVARLVVRNHRRRHHIQPVVSIGPGRATFGAAF